MTSQIDKDIQAHLALLASGDEAQRQGDERVKQCQTLIQGIQQKMTAAGLTRLTIDEGRYAVTTTQTGEYVRHATQTHEPGLFHDSQWGWCAANLRDPFVLSMLQRVTKEAP